jgi:hypothetical protein
MRAAAPVGHAKSIRHAENHLHGNIADPAVKVVEHLIPHVYLRGDTPNGD